MPHATDTIQAPTPATRPQRAKTLFARLRHKQLILAMSGKVAESAVYARRALRVRKVACPCSV